MKRAELVEPSCVDVLDPAQRRSGQLDACGDSELAHHAQKWPVAALDDDGTVRFGHRRERQVQVKDREEP
ncbi:MAG: hypothetical protein WCI05_11840 [Myxococcales bacterium]